MAIMQRLLVIFGCDFGLHDYGPWKDERIYAESYRAYGNVDWTPSGHSLVQTRTCQRCGVTRSRQIPV